MAGQQLSETERAVIEWRCQQLVNRFALLNDACDYDALAQTFTEDGVFARPTLPDQPMIGRQVILEQFRKRPPRTIRHLMANVVITAESSERASGVCYMILYSGPASAEGDKGPPKADGPALIGAFHDTFVKQEGEWLFARRNGSLGLSVDG
ncbi:MAG TPA: nuclear transport factor 2 family protein [Caulobacteraceae bacterium]